MRFRDEHPKDLNRARAAVTAWRDENPAGTPEQLIAAWGAPSLPDCGPPVGSIRKGLGVNGRQEKEFHA
jgi:hypothetical protein